MTLAVYRQKGKLILTVGRLFLSVVRQFLSLRIEQFQRLMGLPLSYMNMGATRPALERASITLAPATVCVSAFGEWPVTCG